jgi:hypothetical protein
MQTTAIISKNWSRVFRGGGERKAYRNGKLESGVNNGVSFRSESFEEE